MSHKKTKLVSLNMGISLIVLKDGKERGVSYSFRCPSESVKNGEDALQAMCDFINDEFGTHYFVQSVGGAISVVKPKEIKARPSLTQAEFNQKVKELVP